MSAPRHSTHATGETAVQRREPARQRLLALHTSSCPTPAGCPSDDAAHAATTEPDDAARPARAEPARGPDPAPHGLPETAAPVSTPEPRAAGRLVRRAVPAPLREARWDPGRPGARALSIVAAVAAVLAAAGVWLNRPVPDPVDPAPALAAVPAAPSTAAPAHLVVSVVGKVAEPGLVRLPAGARVADAVEAAGGRLAGTELLGLNLARKVSDGEQLFVGVDPPPGTTATGRAEQGSGLLDLNTASAQQLEELPGVGPITARSILDWRDENGDFASVDQLREVSGIGPVTFDDLRDLVTA